MNRTKSSAQSNLSKPVSITSQFRFEKVEHLTHLINEAGDTSETRNNVGEKVLELLKTHIRTNYDHLYDHYTDNKKKILKHIQAVETNITGENAMNSRFDDLVKDKSRYDRLHADVGDKQRKLKKLNEIRSKLAQESSSKIDELLEGNSNKLYCFEEQKEELEHQSHILKEMLLARQRINLSLREKRLRLNEELALKQERQNRLAKENEKRLQLLKKITAELEQQDEVEIPIKLAEELSLKMEMYQNKHSYNSIIGHEAILEEQRFAKLKEGVKWDREQQKIAKTKKETEERNQLEQLYNMTLIKQMEEEKVKRYCGVSSIDETFKNENLTAEHLQRLAAEIEQSISTYERENQSTEQSIESLISCQSDSLNQQNLYNTEESLNKEEKAKDLLNDSLKKWEVKTQNWKIILDLLEVQPNSQSLSRFLNAQEQARKSLSESQTKAEQPISKSSLGIEHFQ